MADLTLFKLVDLLGLPTFVGANAGGDRAPNPSSKTQLWVTHSGTQAYISGVGGSTDPDTGTVQIANADGAYADIIFSGGLSFPSECDADFIFNLSGMTSAANDQYFRVMDKVSSTTVRAKSLRNTTLVEETTGSVDVLSYITLKVTTQRQSSFGYVDDAYIPIPHDATSFTTAFDGRRFNGLSGYISFNFNFLHAQIQVAAVEYGTYYKDR